MVQLESQWDIFWRCRFASHLKTPSSAYSQITLASTFRIEKNYFAPIAASKLRLHGIAHACYEEIASENQGLQWSSRLNCHQLTRRIIERMEIEWLPETQYA
jgi:hypothetical protein